MPRPPVTTSGHRPDPDREPYDNRWAGGLDSGQARVLGRKAGKGAACIADS
jgi:hypothetical protein